MGKSKPATVPAPKYNTAAATSIRRILPDGRIQAEDGSVWLLRKVPMAPVSDAKTLIDKMRAFEPLSAAYEELAALANVSGTRRRLVEKNYRQHQLLMVNLKHEYTPPAGHELRQFLSQSFPHMVTYRRVVLLAVKLRDKLGGGKRQTLSDIIDSVAETVTVGGSPLSDYDWDTKRVGDALARSGLTTPTADEIRLADSWWNYGEHPDVPTLAHEEHLHVFSDPKAVRIAAKAGKDDCTEWPHPIPGHRTLTFAALDGLDFSFEPPTSSTANWALGLLSDDAVAVSIRGAIEPAKVTRDELRRQRKRYLDDINERAKQGKMERAEQEEMQATLEEIEGVYASQGGSPTIIDASVLVAFNGRYDDPGQIAPGSAAIMRPMQFRQDAAMSEMMIGSPVRANPVTHDIPSQTLAVAGLQALSIVGDRPEGAALLGWTEYDRQPSYASPVAASAGDAEPIFVNFGATGSGKSLLMLWKAIQYARLGSPQVIVDPKLGSDHSATVMTIPGSHVYSLDSLQHVDGVFDPIRFSLQPEVGIELAASMLVAIDPWSGAKMETELYTALKYGVDNGAKCIGAALRLAYHNKRASLDLVKPVLELADASSLFRACVGFNNETEGLRLAKGITYIKVGNTYLDLPEAGSIATATVMQKVSLALVRMMVFGSQMALTHRRGVIHLDEAWVFLGAGKTEMQRLGRLARSQEVLPELYTQKATDALDAGLAGSISRGLILPLDRVEATAALEMFKIEPTEAILSRITAKATMADGEDTAPNWNSFRALRDPETRKNLRGTLGIYCDLAERAVPIEISLPQQFLKDASTTPEDFKRRQQAAMDAAQAAGALSQKPQQQVAA